MDEKERRALEYSLEKKREALCWLLGSVYWVLIFGIFLKPAYKMSFYLGEFLGVMVTIGVYFLVPITLVNFIQTLIKYKEFSSLKPNIIGEIGVLLIAASLMIMTFILGVILF